MNYTDIMVLLLQFYKIYNGEKVSKKYCSGIDVIEEELSKYLYPAS